MRVLVCGSRTFEDRDAVFSTLHGLRDWSYGRGPDDDKTFEIIHGAARGADSLGAAWAAYSFFTATAYPADWNRWGKRAGFVRNLQMLDEGHPDLVVAFVDKPLPESKGTAMMVDLARKAGVKTIVIEVLP